MSEYQQAIYEIDLYGFTIVKEVLSPDEVASLTEALIRSEQEVGETRSAPGACRHVANLPILNPIFFPVIDHPRVLPLLEHYLGPHLILGSLNSRIVRPGDDEQGFHSDIPVEMLNMDTPVMMNTVWILDDFCGIL